MINCDGIVVLNGKTKFYFATVALSQGTSQFFLSKDPSENAEQGDTHYLLVLTYANGLQTG